MRKTYVLLSVLIAMTSYAQQVPKSLTASNGELIGFYEYKPTDYNTNTRYPLIIFLHGIGERGNGTTELSRVLGLGTPNRIQNGHNMRFTWNGKTETFLVLTPQLNNKYGYWQNFYVDEMINYALKNLSVDPNRIILTGLSLGGGGVWSYAAGSAENAKKLAAIAVTCGTCQNVNYCHIANANLPTWAFHADDDGTVASSCSKNAIKSIESCQPAVKPYLTIWPTGQHWIWDRVYSTGYDSQHPNIYEWFLAQNKSKAPNKRPIANAGPDQTISALTGIATLNGSASTDPDGKLVRYVWTKVSGPGFGTISAPVSTSSTTLVTGLTQPGTYVYELRVIDDRADWAVDQVAITVVSQNISDPINNKKPVVNAGTDITLTLPTNSTPLNGTASDPDGSITSYAWSKVSGPTQFTITNQNSAKATVSNLTTGSYTFRLTVADNAGAVSYDDVVVTVKYPANVKFANAGDDITITLPTNSTMLDGSASYDPAGQIKQYEWTKIAGPSSYKIANPAAAKTTVSNLTEGQYKFRLVVWKNNWEPVADTVVVTVKAGSVSQPPPPTPLPITRKIPNAGPDTTITLPANSVILDGSASYNPNGVINDYEWLYVSGPKQYTIANPKSVTTKVSNLVEGTYKFRLVVWDHRWVPTDDTMQVTVKPAPNSGGGSGTPTQPKRIPNAGPDITITLPTNYTTLDGSASYNPNGVINQYEWLYVSGPKQYTIANPKSVTTKLSNLVEGTYKFRLVVWDHRWVPTDDTMQVIVKPAPTSGGSGGNGGSGSDGSGSGGSTPTRPARIPNAGNDIFLTLPTNSTTLDGSASYNPDGVIKEYRWEKISGPAQYTISNPGSAITKVSNLVQGIYQFRLIVWDHRWVPTADTMYVVVNAPYTPDPKRWANAGPDIFITLPTNSTTLNATASKDPYGGSIKAYEWQKIFGPAQFSISKPTSAVTEVRNLTEGYYSFRLVTWNSRWEPIADTVNVYVLNSGTAAVARSLVTGNALMSTQHKQVTETVVAEKLVVYPNPATNLLQVQTSSAATGKSTIRIFDISGRQWQQVSFEKTGALHQRQVNVSALAPGVYYVEVTVGDNRKMITQFIKQ
jgi:poly(3-hydroxybutyrate) depolymerase